MKNEGQMVWCLGKSLSQSAGRGKGGVTDAVMCVCVCVCISVCMCKNECMCCLSTHMPSLRPNLPTPTPTKCNICLGAATAVDHHARDLAVDDLLFVVEVEHVDGRHLSRGAAGPSRAPGVGMLDQVGVRVLLHEHVLALARAVIGLVALGRDDPVPAKRLKVDSERVAAAA